jgi:tripartite-type tricarboxylate transporter receptor subunit TctC
MLRLLRAAAFAATAFVLATAPAFAQNYPNRPIRIIVPYGAGSAPDVIARTAAEELSPRLGQPVVTTAWAGGKIGTGSGAARRLRCCRLEGHRGQQHLYPLGR